MAVLRAAAEAPKGGWGWAGDNARAPDVGEPSKGWKLSKSPMSPKRTCLTAAQGKPRALTMAPASRGRRTPVRVALEEEPREPFRNHYAKIHF